MNATTQRILTALANAGEKGLTGLDLQARTGLGVGTSYPHLVRLEATGLVTRTWATAPPGTPRRCFYRVTDLGRAEGRQLHLLPPPRSPRRRLTPWRRSFGRTGASAIDNATAPPDAYSTSWPHPVLVRNHLLGGAMGRPIDREECARLRAVDPDIDTRARTIEANRERMLALLADRGLVEQVVDLATGVPAAHVIRSAHVALAEADPPVPVVYVVTDEQLAVATKALVRYRPRVEALIANPCDVPTVWQAATRLDTPRPGRLIHPGRPVVLDALTISDLVPDPRRLRTVLRAWRNTVRTGSVLLVARSLDPALPDPLPIARRAGWHFLPGFVPPIPDINGAFDHPTQVIALTTAGRRWPRRAS